MLHHISTQPIRINPFHKARHLNKKKRVSKACYPCRIKKTKCDGIKPCAKCVQENKICTFSESVKQKDKSFPIGYVELLETRLDLLTRGIERIILMARPHLKFLERIIGDDQSVPINDVISYLINEEGLIKNFPMEWDDGAMIAANLITDNKDSVSRGSKYFEEVKEKRKESLREKEIQERERIMKERNTIELEEKKCDVMENEMNDNIFPRFSNNKCQIIHSPPIPNPELITTDICLPSRDGTPRTPFITTRQQTPSNNAENNYSDLNNSFYNISNDELIKLDMIESHPYYTTTPITNIEYALKLERSETSENLESLLQFTNPFPNS